MRAAVVIKLRTEHAG